jgi:CheY-like chemotaxis protein
VYGIVKQHGGHIAVASTPEAGTTFTLWLPAMPATATEAPQAKPLARMPRGNECILLVEDEPSVRHLTQRVLERCGYRVVAAESGRAALLLWPSVKGDIDLVMTDMVMPDGIEGSELVRQLRNQQPELKAIFTSGYSPEFAGNGVALKPGVNFIQKPYLLADVATIVRTQLDDVAVAA